MVGTGMREREQNAVNTKPLAYRLRESVQYRWSKGSPILILDYPLKAMIFHRFWGPILEPLTGGRFIAFEDILSRLNHVDPQGAEIFLNGLVRKGFLEQEGFPTLSDYPYVSIIIPVRNRAEEITACLQSLDRLDYPLEKREVIVVDDASNDTTPERVSAFPVQLITLKERRQASFCRNLAAQKAKGEILAFLDSDCLADPLWLKELMPAFTDTSNGAVGGMVDSWGNEKGLDRYEKVRSSLNMGSWPKSSREEDHFFYLPSCNLLVRRTLFLRLKGFRQDMWVGEDVDFCWRLQDLGNQIEYRPVGRVYHKHRNKVRHFCTRRFDYGTSEPLLQRFHARRVKQLTFSLPAILFWGSALVSIISGWMLLLGLSGITLLADSLIIFAKIRQRNIPIPFSCLLLAAFRGYLGFFYHCCAFVSRYYLLCAPLLFIVTPLGSAMILGAHVLTGMGEYYTKRPRLNLGSFLLYFTLDQLSYQLGVWWGCIKGIFFGPVNPRIVRRTSYKEIG
jgi:mycofactocin system glycosyltransferase